MQLIRTFIVTFCVILSSINGQQLSYNNLSSNLLYSYFKCKFPTTTIDETFFQNALSSYTTNYSAMSFIQSVYTDISTTPSIYSCVNANFYIYSYIFSIYSPYFLNVAYFNDVVKILSDFKSSHSGISFQQFESQYAFTGVQSPSLDKFSYNYDYTYDVLFLYPTSFSCATNSPSYSSCISQIQTPYNNTTWPAVANKIGTCVKQVISSCDESTQRVLMLEILASLRSTNYVQSFPNGLLSFIDSVIDSGQIQVVSNGAHFLTAHLFFVYIVSLLSIMFFRFI